MKKKSSKAQSFLAIVGWREAVSLPDFHLSRVRVKIDTGAKTSALHAEEVEYFKRNGRLFVRFKVIPHKEKSHRAKIIEAECVDRRQVRSSTGQVTRRPVVLVRVKLGGQIWEIELTLVNRDLMGFVMLLGRQALRGRFFVDSDSSFLLSKDPLSSSKKRL